MSVSDFHKVADADRDGLVDFMFAHAPVMMFPLTNLARYGLGGDHPRAISAWVRKSDDAITDVLTISQEGMVFPCCPTSPWTAAAEVLKGRKVKGFIGEGAQVTALRQICGMTGPASLDALEPAFVLSIADMRRPDVTGFSLQPLSAAAHEDMVDWRMAYEIETLAVPTDEAFARAEHQVRTAKAVDSHRVLLKDGQPVGVTGFNATLPEIVQVGGVYTPPKLRGNGFARVAVAMHLMEAAIDGVTEAVLSAANASAAKVYTAIGFEKTGEFALVIYKTPQVAHG